MKVLIAGDFCPRERVAASFERGDYSSIFGEIRNITSQADYSIVNLECPVVTSKQTIPIEKKGPSLSCSLSGISAIKYAGFDCTTLANNHFYDYGENGVKETIRTLEEERIDYVGGGVCITEASRILYKEIQGKRLAIINCCEHEFSIATPNKAGSNPLDPIQQYYAIQEARKNADKVLVIIHGGHEHFQLPSPRMVETYRFFADAGADVVVNHHQHCFSGYEVYKGCPIFYGLGNLSFDNYTKRSGIWTEGLLVLIDFSTAGTSFSIIPYRQGSTVAGIELLPQDAYNERLGEINSIIASPASLKKEINDYYQSESLIYSNIFEPIRNRYYFGAKRRGWVPSLISNKRKIAAQNFIVCESHRDKLIFWLENM